MLTDDGAITDSWPRGFHSTRPWSRDHPPNYTQGGDTLSYTVNNAVKNWKISELFCPRLPSNKTGAHPAFSEPLPSSLSPP